MIKTFTKILGWGLTAIVLQVQAATLKEGHPDNYTVKKGDTLWGISSTFLDDPWQWPEIWYANPQIANPHLIYPGDSLNLVYVDGKPRLMLKRGEGNFDGGNIKLSPKVRATPIDTAIPAIPLNYVKSFLVDHRVVDQGVLEKAPYVVAGADQRIVLGNGDTGYVRGKLDQSVMTYGVYRPGSAYIDPVTNEFLGMEADYLASAKVVSEEGDISTLNITRVSMDVHLKDRVLPSEEVKLDSVFFPKAPKQEVHGEIIHVFGGVDNVSQYNVVVVNRGARENIGVGDVLAIKRRGEVVRDASTGELLKLPNERSGLMIIFRTFDKVAYGLVLKANRPLAVKDEVTNPN